MLRITGVELTQAIQYFGSSFPVCGVPGSPAVCGDNSLPLVAGKALGVRVFYQGASPRLPVTGAAVKVLSDGTVTATSFSASKDSVDVPWPPIRENADHSVNLLIPPQEARGTWKLSVSIFEKLAAGVGQFAQQVVELQFVERSRVAIRLVRIRYTGERNGVRYDMAAPTMAAFWQIADFAQRLLPSPGICIARESVEVCDGAFRNNYASNDPIDNGTTGTVYQILQRLRAAEGLAPEVIYVGFYPEGASATGGGVSWGPLLVAPDVIPQIFAHELAHSLGLGMHAPTPTVISQAQGTADTGFPRYGALPWGSIGEVGFDPLAQTAFSPTHFDVLGYDEPKWISPHYYQRIFDWVGWPRPGRCGSVLFPPTVPFPGPRQHYFDCYYVPGLAGGIDKVLCGPKIPFPAPLRPWPKWPNHTNGPVRASLYDERDELIFSDSFDLIPLSEPVDGRLMSGFVIRVPELDGAVRLRVTLGDDLVEDSVLDRERVKLEAKAWLPAQPSAAVRVEWSHASEPDLPVFVRASTDDGASWTAFNVPTGAKQLDLDAGALPSGDRCIVEVLAGARLRTTTWRSPPLPLPVAAGRDQVVVLAPRGKLRVGYGQPVQMLATTLRSDDAFDLVWHSDRDGRLGSGPHVIATLSAGRHRLSVRRDNCGEAVDGGEVVVDKPRPPLARR